MEEILPSSETLLYVLPTALGRSSPLIVSCAMLRFLSILRCFLSPVVSVVNGCKSHQSRGPDGAPHTQTLLMKLDPYTLLNEFIYLHLLKTNLPFSSV